MLSYRNKFKKASAPAEDLTMAGEGRGTRIPTMMTRKSVSKSLKEYTLVWHVSQDRIAPYTPG